MKNKPHLRWLLALAGAALITSVAPSAHAQFSSGTISVDFNTTNDLSFGGTTSIMNASQNAVVTPGTWNEIDTTNSNQGQNASGSNISLVLSTGAASGVKMAYSSAFCFNTQVTASQSTKNNSPNYGFLGDYLAATSSAPVTVTLSGLSPSATYRLDLYNASDANGRVSTFTVNGTTQSSTFSTADTTYVAGHNYVEYLNVTSDASGVLTINVPNSTSGESDLDGFQLVGVPEPSTWAGGALLLGAAGLTLRRPRRPGTSALPA